MSKQDKPLKELLSDFEEIVNWFDNDDLDVDEAIAKFEQGSELSEKIKKHLNEAKNKIEIVKKKFDSAESGNSAGPSEAESKK